MNIQRARTTIISENWNILVSSHKLKKEWLTSGSYSHVTFTLKANFATASPSSFREDTLTLWKETEVFESVCVSPILSD